MSFKLKNDKQAWLIYLQSYQILFITRITDFSDNEESFYFKYISVIRYFGHNNLIIGSI